MRNLTNCLNHGEHIVTNLFHLLRVRCLNIEAQQRFGVGRAKVEPPVLCFDCHSVKGVDRDAWLPLELGPNRILAQAARWIVPGSLTVLSTDSARRIRRAGSPA